ncbi:hypothetical protein NUU61_008531 [Penicillium alfredii]|uniref:Uncharacterized protein n=1 Tax=Penicillium alfredii TaxID=1506179 RepID=A0A9W9ELB8_9EURO|nr:uncharacterized protein NUU61_008531 [Penicillium alfredii]KAJ5083952.1 hypothetical protein NUU61_008531 [Penicillium alfredii]
MLVVPSFLLLLLAGQTVCLLNSGSGYSSSTRSPRARTQTGGHNKHTNTPKPINSSGTPTLPYIPPSSKHGNTPAPSRPPPGSSNSSSGPSRPPGSSNHSNPPSGPSNGPSGPSGPSNGLSTTSTRPPGSPPSASSSSQIKPSDSSTPPGPSKTPTNPPPTGTPGPTAPPPSSSSSSSQMTFTTPPASVHTSSLSQSLSSSDTLLTTTEDGHKTVIPVVGGIGLWGISRPGVYKNLPGFSNPVKIPCLVACDPITDTPGVVPPGGGGGDGEGDGEDDNTSRDSSCKSSTSKYSTEFVTCTPISNSQTTTTSCTTSTETLTTTGCDLTVSDSTTTTTKTPEPSVLPLTFVTFTVEPASSTPSSSSLRSSSKSSSRSSSSSAPPHIPLTMTTFTVHPVSTQSSSRSSSRSSSKSSSSSSSSSRVKTCTAKPKPSKTSGASMQTSEPTPSSKTQHSSPTALPTPSSASKTTTPPTTTAPSYPIRCIPDANPDLPEPVCVCTESKTSTYSAPTLSGNDMCGYTTIPSSQVSSNAETTPVTHTDYTYTDFSDSVVKSCATATESKLTMVASAYITRCDDPKPLSTLHPVPGTATLHVWEARETANVVNSLYIAAMMRDASGEVVANQSMSVKTHYGHNVTIDVDGRDDDPINIQPVESVDAMDDGEKRRRSWFEKRIGNPVITNPGAGDRTDLVFYLNGLVFNSQDDTDDKTDKKPPYCSVGGWDHGDAWDGFKEFTKVIPGVALADELINGDMSDSLPNRQLDCYIEYH